jgi:hypothetical protein
MKFKLLELILLKGMKMDMDVHVGRIWRPLAEDVPIWSRMTENVRGCQQKCGIKWIVFRRPIVVAKHLLIQIAVKVEWLDRNVRTSKIPLHQ